MGGDRYSDRGEEHQQGSVSKRGRRHSTRGNQVTYRWTNGPGADCSGAEWGRIYQEPGFWKTDRADGTGILGLHKNKQQILRL